MMKTFPELQGGRPTPGNPRRAWDEAGEQPGKLTMTMEKQSI